MSTLKLTSIGIITTIIVLSVSIWFHYTQVFVQDSPTTATKGILFKKTLKLEAYKNVSSGNDIWGRYDRYSRSDRHTEALTIYCKDFCKDR